MDNPIPLQLKRLTDPFYERRQLDVSYSKSRVDATSDSGFPVYDYNSNNNYSSNNSYSSSNSYSSNHIIDYSYNAYGTDNILNSGCDGELAVDQGCFRFGGVIPSPCLQLEGARLDAQDKRLDPYSPLCMVPLPDHLIEPNFIRRRNERERERVRCVNEGYDKLKEHLPIGNKDRRISKVETLRGAIDYIRELRILLDNTSGE